jgi:hypothetical protein
MNKSEFMHKLKTARAEWESLIEQIPRDQMTMPGIDGSEWSVKDVIAHNTWNELEMVKLLRNRDLATGSDDLWAMSNDERNHVLFERDRHLPLDRVLAEAEEVGKALLEEAAKLEDADLNDPHRFKNMPEGWIPWQIIAGCTFFHYPEHIAAIKKWIGYLGISSRA